MALAVGQTRAVDHLAFVDQRVNLEATGRFGTQFVLELVQVLFHLREYESWLNTAILLL